MIDQLFVRNTLQHFFGRRAEMTNDSTPEVKSRNKLITEFRINQSIVDSFHYRHSCERVYRRLTKIVNRGQVSFLKENELYKLYCVGGTINEDFLHLLDNNIAWFEDFFSDRDDFFLAAHLRYACIIGNITLVKYLIEQKDCKPDAKHVNLAAASGRLTLVKYLLENQNCDAITSGGSDVFYYAVNSGRVKLLKYLMEKYNWKPSKASFGTAVSCGSYHIMNYLHETHGLTGEDIHLLSLGFSKSLPIIKYLVEVLGWRPADCEYNNMYVGRFLKKGSVSFVETAYQLGQLDTIDYVESLFPLETLKSCTCFTNAIQSGSVAALKHLMERYNVAPQQIKQWEDEQYLLLKGILSGNLDMVLYLVHEFDIKPTRKDLLKYAVESGSVSVVLYLTGNHGYEITPDLCNTAFYTGNLEMMTLILSRCSKPVESCVINYFCKDEKYLILVYQLLETGVIATNDSMLESVFSAYKHDEDKEQLRSFYHYLIQTHHLVPTEKMINWMAEKEQEQSLNNAPSMLL
jgi:hypothetical protein